jgi:hypothetical protein
MKLKPIITIFLFLISISAYSTQIEDYYGHYQSINSKNKISFIFNSNGVVNFSINKVNIDTTSFHWYELNRYGSSQIINIEFEDNKGCSYSIMLFLDNFEEDNIWAAGYYVKYKYDEDNDKVTVFERQVLELRCKSLYRR